MNSGHIISTIPRYKGRIFTVVTETIQTPHGDIINRDVVDHFNSVVILVHNRDSLLLTKEYRAGINSETYGLPAGLIDDGEIPLQAAMRELREETGYRIDDPTAFNLVNTFRCSEGFCTEETTVFSLNLAMTQFVQEATEFDEDEYIEHSWIDYPVALELNQQGHLNGAGAVIALQWFRFFREIESKKH